MTRCVLRIVGDEFSDWAVPAYVVEFDPLVSGEVRWSTDVRLAKSYADRDAALVDRAIVGIHLQVEVVEVPDGDDAR